MTVRHWRPARGMDTADAYAWVPAYPDAADGYHRLIVSADDIGRYRDAASCAEECRQRNARQVADARNRVAELEQQLEQARADLDGALSALGRSVGI